MLAIIIPIYGIISYGAENNSIQLDEFVLQIREMITEYGVAENNQETLSVQSFSADSDKDYSEFETMRLIVQSESDIDTLDAVSVISGYKDLWILQFESVYDTFEAYEYYSLLDCVEYVEPDNVITLSETVTQETTSTARTNYLSWGPEHIGFDRLNNYIITENDVELKPVTVAVVDTGIDHNHLFLNGRVEPTGFNSSDSGNANDSMDDNNHGTHVAGIIADCTPNNVVIKPYKVLNNKGKGSDVSLLAGIYKAIENDVDVINMSFGSTAFSPSIKKALLEADEKGIVLVAAAGNNGTNKIVSYPAYFDFVIAVSSITKNNELSSFSNYGTYIDLTAPGTNINSTIPNNGSQMESGTSMATPFVSAAAAMVKAYHGEVSTSAVKSLLYSSATPLLSDNDDSEYFGNGLVNAMGVLNELGESSENLIITSSPNINYSSGVYDSFIEVELTCKNENSNIYYTIDGTAPTENSTVYNGTPIRIEKDTILAVSACAENRRMSKVVTREYRIINALDESFLEIDSDGYILSCSSTENEIIIPESVNGLTVKGIREKAFYSSNYSYIKLPNTVTDIERYSFSKSINLKEFVANGVTEINEYAFAECSALRKMSFDSVESVGIYAFYRSGTQSNSVVYSVELPNLKILDEYAFSESKIINVDMPSLTDLGYSAFYKCTSLKNVWCNILSYIPESAFRGCSLLTNISFPNVIEIAAFSFLNCEKLEIIELPQCVKIGESAFYNCRHLMDVYMSKLTTMYADSFDGCNWLWELELPSLEKIEVGEYYGSIPYLKQFSAPKLTNIPDYYFNCISVENVFVPSVKTVGEYAFSGINTLKYLDVSSLESIDTEYVFYETSGIDFVDAHNLKSAKSLPDNSSILVSSKLSHIESFPEHLTIYGIKGSYAESFANDNNYTFIPIPYIDNDAIPEEISISETVGINAVGFDLTYQWYQSTDDSTENGVAIDGATKKMLDISNVYYAPYYYCVVTCIENDKMYSSKTKPIKNSDYALADFKNVDDALSEIPNDLSVYTQESVEVLNKAIAQINRNTANNNQEQVDKWAEEIREAIKRLVLKRADYSAIETAKAKAEGIDRNLYTPESLAKLDESLLKIDYSLTIDKQTQVEEVANAIERAVSELEYKEADYSSVESAKAKAEGIDRNLYTPESLAKLDESLLKIDYSLTIDKQTQVEEIANAIEKAILELEYKVADYSQLDKALESIPDDLSIYTDESLVELNVILDSIDKNLDITNQSQIDEWAKQVETAVKNLKIKPADYTALDEVISKIPDNLSLYTDESVAELEKVLNSIDRELDITQQEQVDNYVTAVEQAIENLTYKPADYSLVFDAIATIPEDLSIYTPESVDALGSIIDGIDYSLDITQQDKVDEYAEQIKQAVEELEEECWLVRLFRIIVSFFKDIFLCLENCIFNVFDC